MCLYPQLVRNRKYTQNSKNGGIIPTVNDTRTLYTTAGCGKCKECRNQYANNWRIRLMEDLKTQNNAKMVTLTLSNKSISKLYDYTIEKIDKAIEKLDQNKLNTTEHENKLAKLHTEKTGYKLDNQIATNAVRLFLERYRKQNKTSIKHWLITELGHNGTENIHLHGLLWTDETLDVLEKQYWQYGYIGKGRLNINTGKYENWVNEETINYMIKYVTKIDKDHKYYKSKILCSDNIGVNYINTYNATTNKFNGKDTNELYRTKTGTKIALPAYYRNKIYNDNEKELLWLNKLDENVRYVLGTKVDIKHTLKHYYNLLKQAQEYNKKMGYGDDSKDWKQEHYELQRREMLLKKRIQ